MRVSEDGRRAVDDSQQSCLSAASGPSSGCIMLKDGDHVRFSYVEHDWDHSVHGLDRRVLQVASGRLGRVVGPVHPAGTDSGVEGDVVLVRFDQYLGPLPVNPPPHAGRRATQADLPVSSLTLIAD